MNTYELRLIIKHREDVSHLFFGSASHLIKCSPSRYNSFVTLFKPHDWDQVPSLLSKYPVGFQGDLGNGDTEYLNIPESVYNEIAKPLGLPQYQRWISKEFFLKLTTSRQEKINNLLQ